MAKVATGNFADRVTRIFCVLKQYELTQQLPPGWGIRKKDKELIREAVDLAYKIDQGIVEYLSE